MPKSLPTPSRAVVPALFQHQPELRALPIFPSIPPGHMTFPVTDDTFYPHLQPGELAVIDMSDRRPENGELFLIAYAARYVTGVGIKHRLCQALSRTEWERPDGVWTKCPGDGEPHTVWFARHGMRRGPQGDGDFTAEYLSEKLVGRVTGVFVPVLGTERSKQPWPVDWGSIWTTSRASRSPSRSNATQASIPSPVTARTRASGRSALSGRRRTSRGAGRRPSS